MTEDIRSDRTEQDGLSQEIGELQPFAVLERADGSLVVAARAADGTISVAPLIALPDPPRRRMIQCPCEGCRCWLVLSEFEGGTLVVSPFAKPLGRPDTEEPP